ncbi:heavy metal translocating P-type ATPase [Criibacterium bergeronii]|uniref:Cd(2+)-exporting ATPase n=1 Tax=Criibacterium bergeronii TaxID=1871336 RepID=A0A371IIT2_9FIRM|nr:heavy metal translocating P-type ATPase [Criibacterium bergeronii]RDY20392.1 cadmium-translocating P-type ATPase [Criibacterium bergeronii]
MEREQKILLFRIVSSIVLVVIGYFFALQSFIRFFLFAFAYIIVAYDVIKKAVKNIYRGKVFDENFLMSVATIGTFVLAIYTKSGDYLEAVAVILFYQVGELFEDYAVDKSRKSISSLMDIRPDYANVKAGEEITRVDPDEVEVGSEIIVKIGEKVPIDGVVVDGKSSLDTSALTGESMPRDVQFGDEVISGSVNMSSVLTIKTTREFGDSTVSKILELVEDASSNKSRQETYVYKFASIYTPIVCYLALALAVIPPIVNVAVLSVPANFEQWIYRALIFLVISCPCAFVISIPLTFFATLGGASSHGILIKGSNYIQSLSEVKNIIFDKTGSLTKGIFDVNEVHHNDLDEKKLIEYVAHVEYASTHPIGETLKRTYGKSIDTQRVSDVQELSGYGIVAKVDGKSVAVGNDKLMRKLGVEPISCHMLGTILHIAIDGEYAGHIVISDVLKEDSLDAVRTLKNMGIGITMLTGDIKSVADKYAAELGIADVYSELLPQEKVVKVEEIIGKDNHKLTAFVGDGVNDAPALTRADIGVGMGAMGSDAAIEASDVVLMDDNPLKLVKAIELSKKCMSIVYQNTFFSIGTKVLFLILGAIGLIGMEAAVFADVGVLILASLNAMRALK